jgi:hypothetical protein
MNVFETQDEDHLPFEKSDDPEVLKELEGLVCEERIRDLYWSLIDQCEQRALPLFNRLDSYYLAELIRGPDQCIGHTS